MLPVFLALLTTLYIAFSIQGNHSPDRDDRVTNEQVALQQAREGIDPAALGPDGEWRSP